MTFVIASFLSFCSILQHRYPLTIFGNETSVSLYVNINNEFILIINWSVTRTHVCECVYDNLISPVIDFCVSRVPGDGRIGPSCGADI